MHTRDSAWAPLRAAVPSFAERWREHIGQSWYEDDASYGVSLLARHLVDEVAAGRHSELPAFFAALDALLADADEDLHNLLTIGLLEDVVHEADAHDVALAPFERAIGGEHARSAWNAVIAFLHR
jgi:hypothetical protein